MQILAVRKRVVLSESGFLMLRHAANHFSLPLKLQRLVASARLNFVVWQEFNSRLSWPIGSEMSVLRRTDTERRVFGYRAYTTTPDTRVDIPL